MMEYTIILVKHGDDIQETIDHLNQLSSEGWNLMSVIAVRDGILHYFERLKIAPLY